MPSLQRSPSGQQLKLCFISYRHLSNLARSIIHDYAQRARVEVIDRSFDAALEVARERERSGDVDAFISAGANASYLRGSILTPVATIKVSGYDILLALLQARSVGGRVGIVTYRSTITELDAIKAMLSIEVEQSAYQSPDEAHAQVREFARRGFRVIVGSSVVVEAAEMIGLTGILAYSMASVRQGLEDGLELARIARLEHDRYEQLSGVLHGLQDAVLAVDLQNRITALNPAMEAILGRSRTTLIGQKAKDVEAMLSLEGVLESGQAERGIVLSFQRRDWIANRTPIQERGRTTGAMITVYDARSINEADSSLRSQARRRLPATTRYALDDIRGDSPEIRRARETAQRFAAADLTVLLSGETGTGKELFAQAIHKLSARAERPFIAINCSAFPESLLEGELFGHEEGAFTGARKGGKMGLFEAAHRGTVFLDEIGDMPLALQTRLLRVLQEREIVRIGSIAPIPIDIRVIAATHQSLEELVAQRRFRADLYYRLNTLRLRLPPLRERKRDIDALAIGFVDACLRRQHSKLDPGSVLRVVSDWLRGHDWPGNVRELENICERLSMLANQFGSAADIPPELLAHDCPELFSGLAAPAPPTDDLRVRIRNALAACGRNRRLAAERLGISRATLWRRMRELQIGD